MTEKTKGQENTEARKADLLKRQQGFNEELIPLLGKYKLGLAAAPVLTADGRMVAKPVLFDDSEEAKAERVDAQEPKGNQAVAPEKGEDSGLAKAE